MTRPPRRSWPSRRAAGRAAAGGLSAAAVLAAGTATAAAVLGRRVRRAERTAAAGFYDPDHAFAGGNGDRPRADALVVLGAAAYAHGPSGELRARLDHATALWRSGVAPRVIISGGAAHGVHEIDVMRDYLRSRGVPAGTVVPVRPSENTRVLLQSLTRRRERRYVAVSSPYHALRICAEARRQGLLMAVSAPPGTPETLDARTHRTRLVSEVFATVWYALPQTWTARVRTGPGTLRHLVPDALAGHIDPRTLFARRERSGP